MAEDQCILADGFRIILYFDNPDILIGRLKHH